MIDDAVLEELLTSAGEAVEVPQDGPAQVLAARDALGSQGSRRLRGGWFSPRSWRRPQRALLVGVCALAVIAIAVSVTETGGGNGPTTNASRGLSQGASGNSYTGYTGVGGAAGPSSNSGTGASGAGAPSAGVGESGGTPASPSPAGSPSPNVGLGSSPNQVPSLPSKVVKTGSVTLEVASGRLSDTIANLSSQAVGLGGFVASSTQSSGSFSSGDVTLRVPATSFEALVSDAQRLGKVTTLTTSGQDVTSQYVDLQARIQSLQNARNQFQQILTKAQTIPDILSVESQIADLQTQIEQLQGQLQVLDDQANYSTLTAHVTERLKAATAPSKSPSGLSKAWSHARHSFTHGFEAVVSALGGIAVFILFASVLAVLARLGWTHLRRRLI
ncbi:MAG TPA: DUF4349 domain-containing protein [Acidimicrobiales bacterium]|nr:DUF4349 domain-containing protein [Acidimicrobiales bacterium]